MSPVGSAPLVSARDIGVRRSERWIIRHVDVQVPRGALVYVIGANGAGKSTCAKAVLGLIEIDEGAVERAPDLAVGYVPQRLAISPTLPLTLRRLMTLTRRFPPQGNRGGARRRRPGAPRRSTRLDAFRRRVPAAAAGAGAGRAAGPAGPRRAGPGRRRERGGRLSRADRGGPPHVGLRHPDHLPRHRTCGADRRRCVRPGSSRAR